MTGTAEDEMVALALLHQLCLDGTARSLRLGHRLSLSDMGRCCGVDPSTVYRWETADRVPRRSAQALAYAGLLFRLGGLALEVVGS
jgi:transcriptional regulator with XRE-family HTH domain